MTISGFGTFENNLNNGLHIESFGKVTLNAITAVDNIQMGVKVDNSGAFTPQPVTFNGSSTFFSNSSHGVQVDSLGTITMSNVIASENSGYGAYLNNKYGSATGGVTLQGMNAFLENGNTGLRILSYGTVNATRVTADGNSSGGMYLDTTGNAALTCGTFVNNGFSGLQVVGGGGVSVLNLVGVVSSGQINNVNTAGWTGAITIVRNCP